MNAPDPLRRIFVDANVLIAGADSRSGASHAVLVLAEIGLFRLVTCPQVLDEAERNLRKKLPRALPNFVEQMARLSLEIVSMPEDEVIQEWIGVIEPKDAPILASAVLARPNRFLTLNTRDFTPDVAEASGLVIQTPGEFIRELRSLIASGLG